MTVVSLRNGPDVPLGAYRLLLGLEDRGVTLQIADGRLTLSGPALKSLTDADKIALKQWKGHLMAMVEYQPPKLVD